MGVVSVNMESFSKENVMSQDRFILSSCKISDERVAGGEGRRGVGFIRSDGGRMSEV